MKTKIYEVITVNLVTHKLFLSEQDAIEFGETLDMPYSVYEREVH